MQSFANVVSYLDHASIPLWRSLFVLNGRKNMVVHVKRWVNSELTLFKSQKSNLYYFSTKCFKVNQASELSFTQIHQKKSPLLLRKLKEYNRELGWLKSESSNVAKITSNHLSHLKIHVKACCLCLCEFSSIRIHVFLQRSRIASKELLQSSCRWMNHNWNAFPSPSQANFTTIHSASVKQ